MRRRLALGLLLALCVPAGAWGAKAISSKGFADQIQHRLFRMHLKPRPLFPTPLPALLGDADAALLVKGRLFQVFWRVPDQGPRGLVRFVVLTRLAQGQVDHLVAQTRTERGRVAHERLRGRSVTYVVTARYLGYTWHEQGYAYGVVAENNGTMSRRDLRVMVRRLGPIVDAELP
jgi:hypothetical protein